jgi:hypothetical protein
MELYANVCKSSLACAHGEDNIKHTEATECIIHILNTRWGGINDL